MLRKLIELKQKKDHPDIPEAEVTDMFKIIDVIYANPKATPEELQKAYYNYCIKELEV